MTPRTDDFGLEPQTFREHIGKISILCEAVLPREFVQEVCDSFDINPVSEIRESKQFRNAEGKLTYVIYHALKHYMESLEAGEAKFDYYIPVKERE